MIWFDILIKILGWIALIFIVLVILLFIYIFIQSKITDFKLRKKEEESMKDNLEKEAEKMVNIQMGKQEEEEIKTEENVKLNVIEEKQEGEKNE